MIFRVGQKVVCIRGPLVSGVEDRPQPIIGQVYTVRCSTPRIEKWSEWHRRHGGGIYLNEIVSPIHSDGCECGFLACRFRPVVERKTDISCFTEILRNADQYEPV